MVQRAKLDWLVYNETLTYSIEMFAKWNTVLSADIQKRRSSEAELIQQQSAGAEKKKSSLQIIPTTQHILDN